MKTVTSKDNPVLKAARKLHTRKGREASGAFLIEGKKLIAEASAAGFAVEHVFINAGALARGEADGGINEIALEERLFRELAGTVAPQPYMAVVRRPAVDGFRGGGIEAHDGGNIGGGANGRGECTKASGGGASYRALVLDRIGDPGNVGTMIRTALAAGMDAAWCLKGTADVFSDKAIRASAGAIFRLPALEGLSAKDCVRLAAENGMRVLVCDASGADLYKTDLTGSFALVAGNEGAGPQEELLEAAGAVIGIPMAAGVESLNAAAAAAVVMYEARRQRAVGSEKL